VSVAVVAPVIVAPVIVAPVIVAPVIVAPVIVIPVTVAPVTAVALEMGLHGIESLKQRPRIEPGLELRQTVTQGFQSRQIVLFRALANSVVGRQMAQTDLGQAFEPGIELPHLVGLFPSCIH